MADADADAPPRDPTEVLGRRTAAYAIDLALLIVVSVVLIVRVPHATIRHVPSGYCRLFKSSICLQTGDRVYVWNRTDFFRGEALAALVGFVDLVLLQGLLAASIGKLCVGLRVVDESGQKANLFRMLGRWLLLVIDAGFIVVGLIVTLLSHPHRRVGDLAFGTYVVAASSVGQPIFAASSQRNLRGWTPPGFGTSDSWRPPAPAIAVATPAEKPTAPPPQWTAPDAPDPFAPAPQWSAPPVILPIAARRVEAAPWVAPPVPEPTAAAVPAAPPEPSAPSVPIELLAPLVVPAAEQTTKSPPGNWDAPTTLVVPPPPPPPEPAPAEAEAAESDPEVAAADPEPAPSADAEAEVEVAPLPDPAPAESEPEVAAEVVPEKSDSAPAVEEEVATEAAEPEGEVATEAAKPEPEPEVAPTSPKAWWDEALESEPVDDEPGL